MGFEFKHYAFLTILVCSLWAIVVSGLVSVEELGKIKMNSELSQEEPVDNHFEGIPLGNKLESMIKVLNVALPLAFVAIVMLVITYNSNPIGFGSMMFAIVMFLFAASKSMDAADVINASSEFSIDVRVWWM
ncbi:MAG: hypothetical protein P1U89_04730 [Verrucomicrobiales bacterium]|nr:hypothetical protein [Verrucomicrobiales bacterium]